MVYNQITIYRCNNDCEGEALAFIFRGSRRQPAGGGAPFDNLDVFLEKADFKYSRYCNNLGPQDLNRPPVMCFVHCAICKGLFKLQSEERKNKRSVSEAESDSCKTQRVLQGKKQG